MFGEVPISGSAAAAIYSLNDLESTGPLNEVVYWDGTGAYKERYALG